MTHAVVVAGLGVEAAGDFRTYTVLNGDSLHGSGCGQRQRLAIHRALSGWRGAVRGVVNLRAVRAAHGHLRALGELRITAERRSRKRHGTAIAGVTRV